MGKVSGSFKSASLFNSKAESSGDDASDDDRRSPKSEDDGSESDVNSDEEDLQEQVADVPFEVLQKARSDGRSSSFSRSQNIETKRANKNRPMEVTSKKPVPRFREVIQAPKKVLRDPRFESLSGNFDETRFKQAYKFLYEEELPAERQKLQKLLEKKTGSIEAEDLKRNLAWIDRQLKEEAIRRETATKHAERKTKDKEAIKKGKRLYFPKKSELKKAQLVDKFEKLKESGKLDAFLAKRRKRMRRKITDTCLTDALNRLKTNNNCVAQDRDLSGLQFLATLSFCNEVPQETGCTGKRSTDKVGCVFCQDPRANLGFFTAQGSSIWEFPRSIRRELSLTRQLTVNVVCQSVDPQLSVWHGWFRSTRAKDDILLSKVVSRTYSWKCNDCAGKPAWGLFSKPQ